MLTNESLNLINSLTPHLKKKEYDLKGLFNYLDNHHYNYDKPSMIKKRGSYINNQYMSQDLLMKLKNFDKMYEIKWLIHSNYTVACTLKLFTKRYNQSNERINLLINALSFILSFTNRDLNITVNLVLLPDKKLFNKQFTRNEINSGMANMNTVNVYVWRIEECIKVLIHECIHILGFSDLCDTDNIIQHLNQKYNLNCEKYKINETYTEIWAKILNCYYVSKIMHFLNKKYNHFQFFYYLVLIEYSFSHVQTSKIIDFIKNKKNLDINKDTNVMAYYVLTFELLENLDDFLKTCFKNNDNLFYLNNNTKFINLLKTQPYPSTLTIKSKKLLKTFRMTAIELKI